MDGVQAKDVPQKDPKPVEDQPAHGDTDDDVAGHLFTGALKDREPS